MRGQLPKDSWMETLKGTLPRKKIDKSKLRPVGVPEQTIQKQVETYLQLKGLKYMHIPDEIYRLCSPMSSTPIYIKRVISESLKGIPDLMIFKKTGDDILCLMIELKKKNAKARQSQKKWHGELPVKVLDTFEKAREAIDQWSEK